MDSASVIMILIFYVLTFIPCLGIGWLGYKVITKLGRYPTKTPAIQMGVMMKLIVVEVVSVTLILAFFKILVSE